MVAEESGGSTEATGEFVDRGLRGSGLLRDLLSYVRPLRGLLDEVGLLGLRNVLRYLGLNGSLANLRSLQRDLQWALRRYSLVEVRGRFVERQCLSSAELRSGERVLHEDR